MLITSITSLALGLGAAAYLVTSSLKSTVWANLVSSTTTPVISMVQAFEEERRLSLLYLAGDPSAAESLVDARKRSDTALAAVIAKGEAAQRLDVDGSAAEIETFRPLYNRVPGVRTAIDTRAVPQEEAFGFFSSVIETIFDASMIAARVAPEAGIAIDLGYGVEPLRAAEALSKADTLGVVAVRLGQLPPGQLLEFTRHVGEFRGEMSYAARVLEGRRLAQLHAITDSPAWRQLTLMHDALILRGPVPSGDTDAESTESDYDEEQPAESGSAALPLSVTAWQETSAQVNSALLKLWEDQSRDAHAIAHAEGTDTAMASLIAGIVVLIVTVVAFIAALVGANRFIARMQRLRHATLELADERLPDLMRRLDDGAEIDTAAEVARLDFGTDELGEVADAFNRAQVAAVSAAVAEARTRAGFRTVFLNIAHRNQLAVHRQLALLDRAERREENADQLELLFQLDHLATRARRHAENLIVLGGEQPGRRWRKPVPLWDLVRGAAAESLDYTRIHTGDVPEVHITGQAAADLIHLLAELMENATAFSPPESRVEVSAALVGRGIAVEVADQGLGMSAEEIAAHNRLLAEPPDFGVAALTGDTRLGLFVVATLAARHGVSVRLSESVYGGIRAVVLIPATLIEPCASTEPSAPGRPRQSELAAAPATTPDTTSATRTPQQPERATAPSTTPGTTPGTTPATGLPRQRERDAANGTTPGTTSATRTSQQPERATAPSTTPGTTPATGLPRQRERDAANGTAPGTVPTVHLPQQPGHTAAPGTARAGGAGSPRPASGATEPQARPAPPRPDGDTRPALPRRRRKSAEPEAVETPVVEEPRARTPEQARNLMAAIEGGTRSGRHPRPDQAPPSRIQQKGDDDHSPAH
ncbi:sensor histidine kinase [Nocardia sp. X0981]